MKSVKTEELIQQLAGQPGPVHRLAAPWQRTLLWLALSAAYAALFVFFSRTELSWPMTDKRYVLELIATGATAITAAIAAFCSVIPGYHRKWLWLPVVPLAVWLAALGEGCVHDWLQAGRGALTLRDDWDCVESAAVIGIIPAFLIVFMLRRGAPLVPHASLALAAVAVAALSNFVMRLHHYGDASIIILVWHLGSVLLVALIASAFGSRLLKWRHKRTA